MRVLLGFLLFGITGLITQDLLAEEVAEGGLGTGSAAAADQEMLPPRLLHQREGGTPYDPNQPLQPYAIKAPKLRDLPTSGLIASPPEYDPVQGVLFYYISSQWPAVVRDLVVALTEDPQYDEIAYVVVPNASQQTSAESLFTAGGADMSKVEFFIEPGNALWIRDYGPHFIWQDGALGIVDSHYYPTRPLDNFIPTLVGDDDFLMPTYDMGLYYSGGNFQPGPGRSGYVTSLIDLDNPASEGFDAALIAELFSVYQGIDTLHIMPQLPGSVDGTGHIDMWFYLVDENTVIISAFKTGSNPTAIQITNEAATYMKGQGYSVFRTPAWNATHPSAGYMTHWTYTNAFRVNDRIFIPTYGESYPSYADEDADAIAAWETAAGASVEIVPINSYDIIWAAGAVHCIVMQVPRYTDPTPAAHVIWPDGGELLVGGTTQTISWVATDTDNVTIPQIDLYYSINDGGSYDYIDTTTDTGFYDWTVPDVATTQAKVKVIATSADSDQVEAVSAEVFQIAPAHQTVYDFTTGASVDKFGWGHQTSNWNSYVDGNRTPVSTEVDSLQTGAYSKLAYSDATGGDGDSNRYHSPNPSSNYESTHVFEFTIDEDPALIDDIGIRWEGYADQCAQIELYVWDYVEEQWSDGEGFFGQNRFMDNWAGNRDAFVEGHLRSDFARYVDPSGQLTLLTYSERPTAYYSGWLYTPTFHDHVAVTVTRIEAAGDSDGDGDVDLVDYSLFTDCMEGPDETPAPTPPVEWQDCVNAFDFDDDLDVDMWDFGDFQEAFTG